MLANPREILCRYRVSTPSLTVVYPDFNPLRREPVGQSIFHAFLDERRCADVRPVRRTRTIKEKLIVRKKLGGAKLAESTLREDYPKSMHRRFKLDFQSLPSSDDSGFRSWRRVELVQHCLVCFAGQHLKKSSMSESSSEIMELEEGILLTHPEITKKPNCNPRHNNNINPACMSIETDV